MQSSQAIWLTSLLYALFNNAEANLRCYSCLPCNELEYYSGDIRHFEADCYLDRYCMKISGRTRDIFGYTREVNFRGCPWVSILGTLEEGCSESSLEVAGFGLVQGTVCLCKGHLCNGSYSLKEMSILIMIPLALLSLSLS